MGKAIAGKKVKRAPATVEAKALSAEKEATAVITELKLNRGDLQNPLDRK